MIWVSMLFECELCLAYDMSLDENTVTQTPPPCFAKAAPYVFGSGSEKAQPELSFTA
jgi:hypothetical protein